MQVCMYNIYICIYVCLYVLLLFIVEYIYIHSQVILFLMWSCLRLARVYSNRKKNCTRNRAARGYAHLMKIFCHYIYESNLPPAQRCKNYNSTISPLPGDERGTANIVVQNLLVFYDYINTTIYVYIGMYICYIFRQCWCVCAFDIPNWCLVFSDQQECLACKLDLRAFV